MRFERGIIGSHDLYFRGILDLCDIALSMLRKTWLHTISYAHSKYLMGRGIHKVFTAALIGLQICVVCLFILWNRETHQHLTTQETRGAALEEEAAQLAQSIDQGRAHIHALREDKAYLEAVAREKLTLGESDEFLVKFPDRLRFNEESALGVDH